MPHQQDKKSGTFSIRAFTQLCTHVNISIFGDVMTLYIKLNDATISGTDPRVNKAIKNLTKAWPNIGQKNEIRRHHKEHYLLHQDGMDRDNWHTHIQFAQPLDEKKFTEVLDEFVKTQLISPKEKMQLIDAFQQANQLSRSDMEILIAKESLKELKKATNKNAWLNNNKLKAKMMAVIQQFEQLINKGENTAEIKRYIEETLLIVKQPTQENLKKLREIALKAENSFSLTWQGLGMALMALGAVLGAAAMVITAGSAGISLAPALGLTLSGLGFFAAGTDYVYHGTQHQLSKELTALSKQMLVEHNSKNEEELDVISYQR